MEWDIEYTIDMQHLSNETFTELVNSTYIPPRIKREVRFNAVAQTINTDAWQHIELLAIPDRSGTKGVILLQGTQREIRVRAYEVSRGITSSTGKAQPIICDFCRTWQTGSRSGSITLYKPNRGAGTITFLCCADLLCSQHVRNLTSASRTSRSQLREDLTTEQRVARLRERIETILERC